MSRFGEGKVVCVTGASGYVASWLVKLLLQRGYTVRATVRHLSDPSKVDHLKSLQGAEERLHLVKANLVEDGSFDYTVDGCDAVFHTASPVGSGKTDPQAELMEPAVKGTLNVLKSCSKAASVRRVVMTSTTGAVLYNRNYKGCDVEADETWFSDPALCEEKNVIELISKDGMVLSFEDVGRRSCMEICRREWDGFGGDEPWTCAWPSASTYSQFL